MESLPLLERRLHPEVRGAWQNTFCEPQDAFDVEFFELTRVTFDPNAGELLAQLLGVAVVRLDVERASAQQALILTP